MILKSSRRQMGAWKPGIKSQQHCRTQKSIFLWWYWETKSGQSIQPSHWRLLCVCASSQAEEISQIGSWMVSYAVCTNEVYVLFLWIFNHSNELAAFPTHVLYLWLFMLWLFLMKWNNINPWYTAAANRGVHQRKLHINNKPNEGYKTHSSNNPDTTH